jgi:DNA sulfur modification protein DndB
MELLLQAVLVRRGLKKNQKSYAAMLTFGDVVRLIDDQRLYVPNEPDLADFAQRKLNPTRVNQIAKYILDTYQDGSTFFPPICVNIQPAPIYRNGTIVLPYDSASLRLTDGQHRCFGIHRAIKQLQESRLPQLAQVIQLELPMLVYSALPLEMERQAFRDQNLLAQRPGKSLSHFFDKRSPEVAIAREICRRVPQFRGNIETVENGLGKHNPKLMTLSTLVTSTQHMFPHLRAEDALEPFADWAITFWAAAASALPGDPWCVLSKEERKQQREESIVGAAIVFQALGFIGRDLFTDGVPVENLVQWLSNLSDINWDKQDDMWLQRGVIQLNAKGLRIIQNTRTTVNSCHLVLRELLGVTPEEGVVA